MKIWFPLALCLSGLLSSCHAQAPDPTSDQLVGKTTTHLVGDSYQLQPQVAEALTRMTEAAAQEGITIKVVSAFRSYERQRAIWNRKYRQNEAEGLSPEANRAKIIEYSTLPGTSRHHWGTDIDLIDGGVDLEGDVLLAQHFHQGGPFEKLRLWLEKNAATYGFYCAYPDDPNRSGFAYEPWHYSYAPIAQTYYRAYQKIDRYPMLQDSLLAGQKHLTRTHIDRYRNTHINGIAPILK
jgi:LAS superfamily LD-carboxypeptidase LdcB